VQDSLLLWIVLLTAFAFGGGLTALMIITNQDEVITEANKIITEHKYSKEKR